MKKVFITGGAGLIGSCVARKLLTLGYQPICYDPFIHYISPLKVHIKNYIDLRFEGIEDKVIFERGDVTNIMYTRKIIEQHKPAFVIHLGGMPLADMSNVHVEEAVSSVLGGTVTLLEIIKDTSYVENFVYVSSSMIYGDFIEFPCPETHPQNPKDVYGGTKLAGEIMTKAFGRRFSIPYTIIRPSAVYGPFDVNRRVSQIFIENALMGKPLRLDGAGELVLDFTYVEDISDGLVLAMINKKSLGEVFNITYGTGYSLKQYAEILKSYFPDLKIHLVDSVDPNRPIRGALCINKARQILGYDPKFPLEKGVDLYVKSYQKIKLA